MATSYKLIYFNGRGRAELSRYIFAQAGVEYEDCRVAGEEFTKLKPTLPAGSLPVLEVDGKPPLAGSRTIARFLGERFNLAGETDFDNAQLDSLVDVVNDLMAKVIPCFFGEEEKKAAAKKDLLETHLPKYFEILEKRVVANNSADGWAYGNKLTYVDMLLSLTFDQLLGVDKTINDRFPALKKLNDAVKAQPKIAEWIKKRPETPF